VNPLKSRLQRTTAVLAGTVLGVAGAVALATPASAHHADLSGKPVCTTGGNWTVEWSLTNWNGGKVGVIEHVASRPAEPALKVIVKDVEMASGATLSETQNLTAADSQAFLEVRVGWPKEKNPYSYQTPRPDTKTVTVEKPAYCPEPTTPPTTVPPTTTPPTTAPPTTTPPTTTPPTTTPPTTTPPTTTPPAGTPAEPNPILEMTCDSLTIGLDNPADGEEVSAIFEPSTGEKQQITVKPGEKKTVTFPASEGFTVRAIPVGFEEQAETITWESPEDCDTSGGGGGSLPKTGIAVGGIVAGAALLLAVGAGLFVIARRRRVKFTA
jgi:LPXTG-motif cell wall-anchored protein